MQGYPTIGRMKTLSLKLSSFLLLVVISACTQAPPQPPGSTSYSPYTPQQIQEFNKQSISPVEGPFGPVDLRAEDLRISKERSLDAQYYNQPSGEKEAEALETQSVAPYRPMSPVITY